MSDSIYHGIEWVEKDRGWEVRYAGKVVGFLHDEEDAALAYDMVATSHGDSSRLNFDPIALEWGLLIPMKYFEEDC